MDRGAEKQKHRRRDGGTETQRQRDRDGEAEARRDRDREAWSTSQSSEHGRRRPSQRRSRPSGVEWARSWPSTPRSTVARCNNCTIVGLAVQDHGRFGGAAMGLIGALVPTA
eukprot:4462419-Alexandrium_andersonii.AAC.2